MKIYVDLIFLLNFGMDFLLLLTLNLLLKRKRKIRFLFLGSLVGGLSVFLLFLNLNSFTLFLWKFGISLLMLWIGFGFHDIKYFFQNFVSLYLLSILVGGFLYFLNLQFSYQNVGLVFFYNGFSINFLVLLLSSPIILFLYLKQYRRKAKYQYYRQVALYYKGKKLTFSGYVDTGNKLHDPYSKKPIHLLYDPKLKYQEEDCLLVPYSSLNHHGLLKCLRCSKIVLDEKTSYENILVGLSEKPFHLEGVDLILNQDYLEG